MNDAHPLSPAFKVNGPPATVLRVDGTREAVSFVYGPGVVESLIGATCIDGFSLGDPRLEACPYAYVDDLGYESSAIVSGNTTTLVARHARKPVNVDATRLYWLRCGGRNDHEIVGDVLVVYLDPAGIDALLASAPAY